MSYDDEFGPNTVIRCQKCLVKLHQDEVCWCSTTDEEGSEDEQ